MHQHKNNYLEIFGGREGQMSRADICAGDIRGSAVDTMETKADYTQLLCALHA